MKNKFTKLAIACAALTAPQAFAVSLQITGAIQQTVGTTAIVAAPPAGLNVSGTADNTNTWTVGQVGLFEMNNGAYYMQVNATNPTGAVSPTGDSLMVARTVNSQGLVDTGTLSIYIRPNPATGTNPWELDVNFSFFTDIGLTTPAPITLLLTSLDIDFNQRYYTSDSTFSANILNTPTTNIVDASAEAGYSGFTSPANSLVNDPLNAVASVGTGNSFDIRLGHDAVALFMFEFRDPSTITGLVPEPSTALLGGLGLLALLRRRR